MPRSYVPVEARQFIAERAKGRCEYCRSPVDFATQAFSVEHIYPLSRGGETKLDNLALACQGCNGHKYTKVQAPDPVDGSLVPLYNPRTQRWRDHFRWNEDFSAMLGVTPTGRATVKALQMNRPGLVKLRGVLFATGLHPPANDESG